MFDPSSEHSDSPCQGGFSDLPLCLGVCPNTKHTETIREHGSSLLGPLSIKVRIADLGNPVIDRRRSISNVRPLLWHQEEGPGSSTRHPGSSPKPCRSNLLEGVNPVGWVDQCCPRQSTQILEDFLLLPSERPPRPHRHAGHHALAVVEQDCLPRLPIKSKGNQNQGGAKLARNFQELLDIFESRKRRVHNGHQRPIQGTLCGQAQGFRLHPKVDFVTSFLPDLDLSPGVTLESDHSPLSQAPNSLRQSMGQLRIQAGRQGNPLQLLRGFWMEDVRKLEERTEGFSAFPRKKEQSQNEEEEDLPIRSGLFGQLFDRREEELGEGSPGGFCKERNGVRGDVGSALPGSGRGPHKPPFCRLHKPKELLGFASDLLLKEVHGSPQGSLPCRSS